ncbi:glycoside hydrolase family 2 protein [Lentinula aciculospora]|uniref:Beta-mannosidase B n=1 Tax=Lentinula aciculospora TaxID=153920 RepID=A0A9W9AB23_9AGAR|nr:glycoside hydrolase family 2 protein [Lentinula aciculospora]
MKKFALDNWTFTQAGGGKGTKKDEYLQATGPTSVHVELLKAKRIPDPFVGLHEYDVQWIGESDWIFKQMFILSEEDAQSANIGLVFDGLDTFATIMLNGVQILETANQFVGYRVNVKSTLRTGENELVLNFSSAFKKGRDIEKQHGKLNLWNGDSSRLHVRKAQYNYGWDWGPILMTVGPWKPVYLELYKNRISDLDIRNDVSKDLDVRMTVDMTLFDNTLAVLASLALKAPDGTIITSNNNIRTNGSRTQATFSFGKGELQLWYPVGYGKQPIYTVEADLIDEDGTLLDSKTQKVGFRRTVIVQEKLLNQPGLSFFFEVNNVPIFAGGSNWIPSDSFLTTMTPGRYRDWLKLLVDGNQNMIRVWGGGIYEADSFYDICDGKQDFMFGCGQYPAYDSFLSLVKDEAEYNVKRLRHHPSLSIFAGNNEDYQVAESMHLELDYSDESSDFRKTNFPARYIYERVLPEIVGRLSNIHYHRSSPYSGQGKASTDLTLGDLHQWNVWHGSQEPWTKWDILAGRFVSEFGMEGYPNIRTVDYWLEDQTKERFPQSRTNTSHNKADGFERRLELYLVENFKHSFEMESYVYATQIMQAECLASAYRLWRRNWAGKGKEYTAGALVWQLNDCWPTTSWSIADYFLRPKPAYFSIARELRPCTVGITRKEVTSFADERSAADFTIDTLFEVWGTNSTLTAKNVTLEFLIHDLHDPTFRDGWTQAVTLSPNSSTEVFKGPVNALPRKTTKSQISKIIIVSARLLDENGTVLARYSNWPEPYKFIDFPKDVAFTAEVSIDGESVKLSSKRPMKGIVLDVEGEDVKWSDQAIDLIPGDDQVIRTIGLKGRSVQARYVGDQVA